MSNQRMAESPTYNQRNNQQSSNTINSFKAKLLNSKMKKYEKSSTFVNPSTHVSSSQAFNPNPN